MRMREPRPWTWALVVSSGQGRGSPTHTRARCVTNGNAPDSERQPHAHAGEMSGRIVVHDPDHCVRPVVSLEHQLVPARDLMVAADVIVLAVLQEQLQD